MKSEALKLLNYPDRDTILLLLSLAITLTLLVTYQNTQLFFTHNTVKLRLLHLHLPIRFFKASI